ncbi:MAG: malonyl-ACP O-methyltransferase BioC [Spirochaetes bacterium]|nr:malonyl-ACP O-methyltransferase BioC [Spirochaetota bacterium]
MDKKWLKLRFSRSLPTYDEQAVVQNQMAKRLLDQIIEQKGKRYPNIFEIGCGTGLLTRRIVKQIQFNQLYANDIVNECRTQIENISQKIHFIGQDIEQMTKFPVQMDLIISNATLQWIENLPNFLLFLHSQLTPNGILAFTLFGNQHYTEFNQLHLPALRYHNIEEIKMIANKYFHLVFDSGNIHHLYFNNPLAVLKHIQATGVNSITPQKWTRKILNQFINQYKEAFDTPQGVSLTYHPLYFILEKKP